MWIKSSGYQKKEKTTAFLIRAIDLSRLRYPADDTVLQAEDHRIGCSHCSKRQHNDMHS